MDYRYPFFSKGKTVIPVLYQLFPVREALLLKGKKNFFLRKSEAVRIFIGGCCHHLRIHGEELLNHAHVQSLSEPSRTGDESHVVGGLPPLPDKIRFVYIEAVVHSDFFKVLIPDTNHLCH